MHVQLQPSGSVVTVSRANVARSAFDPKGVQARMAWWRLVEHMRRSVVPQVLAFKCRNSQTRAAEGGPQTGWECALCDAFVCEQSEAHADHVYEFNRLVRDHMGARPDVACGSAESLPLAVWFDILNLVRYIHASKTRETTKIPYTAVHGTCNQTTLNRPGRRIRPSPLRSRQTPRW